jgi:hypothetical protein
MTLDLGGTTPGETAATAATFERRSDAKGRAASSEPADYSGLPTLTAQDHGGTTPGEAAAAAATVGAPRTAEGSTKAKR